MISILAKDLRQSFQINQKKKNQHIEIITSFF